MIGVISKLLSPPPREDNAVNVHTGSKAHRNVAIAEWLLGMETRRILMEEQDADQDKLLLRLDTMREFVEYRKEELESLPNLMNVMLPQSSPPHSQFDHYLDLPGSVVRERIISFVSDPQDKLNLLEVYPKDKKFFKLTRAELQFEVDFPRWIADGRLRWVDDHDRLHQLAGISDHHRKVILEHFENHLVNDITNPREQMDSYDFELDVDDIFYSEKDEDNEDENEEMEGMIDVEEVVNRPRLQGPQEFIPVFPRFRPPVNLSRLPVTLRINLDGTLLQNLSWFIKFGGSIWDFHLYYDTPEDWSSFCVYLEIVPNVRSLYFENCEVDDEEDEEDGPWTGNLESSLLPELPHLKSLQLYGSADKPSFFPVCQRLLEKYGRQLNKLVFTICQFPEVGLPPCPKLTILSFTDWTDEPEDEPRNCEMVLQFLSNFENAPLRVLKLEIREVRGRYALYQMLEFASLKFGGTLEHLELEFRARGEEFGMGNESAPPSWNILDAIYLPKLKHFGTNVNPKPDGWRYLLLIPSLETLTVDKTHGEKWEAEEEQDDEEIGLSEQSIRRFNLWKWLPRLQTIQLVKPFKDYRSQGTITVSREQAFLQN